MQTTTTSPTVHTNAEIAAKLFIAAKTVDPYVSAELAKLDAPTRDVAASPPPGSGWPARGNIGHNAGNLGNPSRSGTRASCRTVALNSF
jgi:hypothetical protein